MEAVSYGQLFSRLRRRFSSPTEGGKIFARRTQLLKKLIVKKKLKININLRFNPQQGVLRDKGGL